MRCTVFVMGVFLFSSWAHGQLPSFSLDDNPSTPITSPPGLGLGAEDPYGLGTFGVAGAPSPSLGVGPFMDADLITVGPTGLTLDTFMSIATGGPLSYVNAVSTNTFINGTAGGLNLMFSVDRVTTGSPGSGVAAQTALNQQPADIYHSVPSFVYPTTFVGTPTAPGFNGDLSSSNPSVNGNTLMADESLFGLTATGLPGTTTPLNVPGSPIGFATHDNIDAIEVSDFDLNGDTITDRPMYFSTGPDDLVGLPSTIFHVPSGTPTTLGTIGIFATFAQIGLDPFLDDIDGLVVWNTQDATTATANPGQDFALFSLAHGSAALASNGLSEADIFFTDFTGGFHRYLQAGQLGLGGANDNVDAMDIVIPGDANLDGFVDAADAVILLSNLFTAAPPQLGWLLGDFNSSGFIGGGDFTIWNSNRFSAQDTVNPVPEPSALALLLLSSTLPLRLRRTT